MVRERLGDAHLVGGEPAHIAATNDQHPDQIVAKTQRYPEHRASGSGVPGQFVLGVCAYVFDLKGPALQEHSAGETPTAGLERSRNQPIRLRLGRHEHARQRVVDPQDRSVRRVGEPDCIFDDCGEHEIEVRILSPDKSTMVVTSQPTKIQLAEGGFTDNVSFFVNVVFPTAGTYWIQTIANAVVIDETPLIVTDQANLDAARSADQVSEMTN